MHPDYLLSGTEEVLTIFGIPIIRRMRPGLNARQLAEWEAMDRLDPVGEWRADFRIAMLSSLVLNIALKWAAGRKSVKLSEITDFMPKWDGVGFKETKVQSVDEMKRILLEIAKTQNKKVEAEKRRSSSIRPPSKLKSKKDG